MASAYPPELLSRALPLMTRPHPRLLGSGRYYLCEADGEAVGCGGWSIERPGGGAVEPGIAHIRHFAVRADRIGRGVGRTLYERCARDARVAGITAFECWSSLNGEGFYAVLGFERVAAIDVPMPDGVTLPSILMRRPI
ncbi:MAG: GNAT family N-acetyltransferase [Pseudomonadota bacterium]|nr:GNAT family N-acetyltransferase [Pseudomonadota bacterium]